MRCEYLKNAALTSKSNARETTDIERTILDDIEAGRDAKALEYSAKFDQYDGPILLTDADIQAAIGLVPEKLKADIQFAHENVRRFAEAQKATVANFKIEVGPGLIAGQKAIPVDTAGCYVPGGR